MNCPVCKSTMDPGHTELVLKRNRSIVVIEDVPSLVCSQCGEASLDSETSQRAYEIAEREFARGVALEYCHFPAA